MLLPLLTVEIDQFSIITKVNITDSEYQYNESFIVLGIKKNTRILPKELFNMTQVTNFNIFRIKILCVPKGLINYTNLEALVMDDIIFKNVPKFVYKIGKLRRLHISSIKNKGTIRLNITGDVAKEYLE